MRWVQFVDQVLRQIEGLDFPQTLELTSFQFLYFVTMQIDGLYFSQRGQSLDWQRRNRA